MTMVFFLIQKWMNRIISLCIYHFVGYNDLQVPLLVTTSGGVVVLSWPPIVGIAAANNRTSIFDS